MLHNDDEWGVKMSFWLKKQNGQLVQSSYRLNSQLHLTGKEEMRGRKMKNQTSWRVDGHFFPTLIIR